MKAKELAANLPKYFEEKNSMRQAIFHVMHLIIKDTVEVAKKRNVKAHSAVAAVYDEAVDKWNAFCRLADKDMIGDIAIDFLEPEALPVFMISVAGKEGEPLYILLAWYKHSRHKVIRECLGRQLKDELEKLSSGHYGLDPQTGSLRRISNV